jgi:alanyl aminopeptidase
MSNRLFLVYLAALSCAQAQPAPGFTLPDTVRPAKYVLDLQIRPEEPTFEGMVKIDLDFHEPASVFWLNARNLIIHSADLNGAPLRLVEGNSETVGFAAAGPIPRGPAQVTIRYTGKLDKDSNDGAFRRLVGDDWYVFTTFTPIEARRAFPCFDEPRFKAPWQLILHVKQNEVALGNAPEQSETDEPEGLKRVVFAPTAPLPSEVVAFAVGPFDIVDAGRAGKKQIPVRIITPRGRAADAESARIATPAILSRLEDYTDIPYPWDKLDHLALVKGAFGAVENPGLITYQEGILLAEPGRDTPQRNHQMRATMAHELAHQWFGNLVTQASWTDVWLSEGFATWLSAKVMDVEYPPFERGMAGNPRFSAMAADRAGRGWAVRRPIASREEAKTVYNGLVYQKGAAVLDTVESWLGEEPFQRGLQKYLADHSFGNATVDDLAAALQSASGVAVAPVLHSLLDRAGVPVVTSQLDCKRLTVNAGDWTLPICLHWDGGGHQCSVVSPGEESVAIKAPSCPAWIWTNASGQGYYRSSLTDEDLKAMQNGGYQELTSPERRALISDVGFAVLNGQIPAAGVMKLLASSARDQEPRVAMESLRIAVALGEIVPPAARKRYAAWLQLTYGVGTPAAKQAASLAEFFRRSEK